MVYAPSRKFEPLGSESDTHRSGRDQHGQHFLADEKPIVDGISGYFARLPAALLQTTLSGGLARALEDLKTQVEAQGERPK